MRRPAVHVDAELCVGSGQCALYCPEVFEIVDDVARVHDPHPPEHHLPAVGDAADACPVQAITVAPAGDGPGEHPLSPRPGGTAGSSGR